MQQCGTISQPPSIVTRTLTSFVWSVEDPVNLSVKLPCRIGCMYSLFLTTPTSMQNNSDEKRMSVLVQLFCKCSILDQITVQFATVILCTATLNFKQANTNSKRKSIYKLWGGVFATFYSHTISSWFTGCRVEQGQWEYPRC